MEERRKEMVNLNERFNELHENFAVLNHTVTEFMSSTKDYRKDLCAKLDRMNTIMNNFPCEARSVEHTARIVSLEKFRGKTEREVGRVFIYIILGLFATGTAWGILTRTVAVNTGRIDGLEIIHPRIENARKT